MLILCLPVLKANSQTNELKDPISVIDSIKIADSLKILALTQELQQMKLNEILYMGEIEKSRTSALSDSLKQANHKTRIDSLRSVSQGSPVIIEDDTVFVIYASLGGHSPFHRSVNAQTVINELGNTRSVIPDSIYLLPSENFTDIMYDKDVITSVTKDDALWMNASVDSLSHIYRANIIENVKILQEKNSLKKQLIRIALFTLVILIQIALFWLIAFLYRKAKKKIIKESQVKFKPVSIRNYEVLNAAQLARITIFGINVLRYVIMLVMLLISVPILFSIFPQTKDLATKLFSYIINPVKSIGASIIAYAPNLFTIIIIWLAIRYVIKGLKYIANEIHNERLKIPGFYPDWARPSFNVIRFLLYAFMIAMIYPYLPGSSSGVFQGISVFVGLIVSLGSSSVIANIMAGFVITYMRPFKIGDRIKLNDTTGNVIEKTPFVTRIKTVKNEVVTIPNSFIMSSHTVNYSASAENFGLILHTKVTVGYEVPWTTVHELLIKAATVTEGVMESPKPFVLELELHDFYVVYQINVYITDADKMSLIYSNLFQSIQDTFNEAGIELLSPHYRAERDGNQTTIPEKYRKS